MPFDHNPTLLYLGAGRYKTCGATAYVGATQVITIPSDFPTDLASVPRLFWTLLPPCGVYEKAAVLHDSLCVRLHDQLELGDPAPVNSRDTDGLFRRVMREEGVGLLTRWVMWTGVRWGALANPARRAGWIKDAPAVVGISAAILAATLCALLTVHVAVSALLDLI